MVWPTLGSRTAIDQMTILLRHFVSCVFRQPIQSADQSIAAVAQWYVLADWLAPAYFNAETVERFVFVLGCPRGRLVYIG